MARSGGRDWRSDPHSAVRTGRVSINLKRLRYFCAVVRAGSVSGAAAEFGIAQPAISNHIRELEQEFGVSLLERHSRGVRPTAAGSILFERAIEFDIFANQILADVRAAAGQEVTPLVIGLTPSLMRLVGVDTLVAAAEGGGPPLRLVEALSVALTTSVERREIDIAFAYEVEERPGLVREPVILDELLFVTAPGSADGPISFHEAVSQELFFAGDHGIVALVRRMAEQMSLTPRIVSNVQSVDSIRARIGAGGASLLSYGTAADGVKGGFLAVRRIENPSLTRTLYLLRRADTDPARRDARIEMLLTRMIQRILRASAPFATLLDFRYTTEKL